MTYSLISALSFSSAYLCPWVHLLQAAVLLFKLFESLDQRDVHSTELGSPLVNLSAAHSHHALGTGPGLWILPRSALNSHDLAVSKS